jgi:hypothetical protein
VGKEYRMKNLEWGIRNGSQQLRRRKSTRAETPAIQPCVRWYIVCFAFRQGQQGVEYAAALIVGRRAILGATRKVAGPFLAGVQIRGKVVMLEPKQEVGALTSREKTERKYGRTIQETQSL